MSRSKKTVSDACISWLKTCARNELERSTLKAYRSHVRIHIEPRIGSHLLADLSRAQSGCHHCPVSGAGRGELLL